MTRKIADRTSAIRRKPADGEVGPLVRDAGGREARLVGQPDEQERDRDREHAAAEEVDVPVGVRPANGGQQPPDDDQADDADRDVDEEDPVPAGVVGEQAADGRAEDERQPEDGAEQALVTAALGRAEQVADDGQRDREQRAGADALQATEDDQLLHGLAQARQGGADQEHGDPEHQQRLAAEQVGQLAVEGDGDRGREQVDRDDPRVQLVAVQIGDDLRQGGADDGLVERAEEQREQHRAEDFELLPMAQSEGGILGERRAAALDAGRHGFHE